MTLATPDTWFATCPKGVESLLAEELTALGASATRETVAGVHFSGAPAVAYRACLWSRLANRILWPLASVRAGDSEEFYRGLRDVDWASLFAPEHSMTVDFIGTNAGIRNTQFGAQRCKDAVVDSFVQACGQRPAVDRQRADVRINVRLSQAMARVSVDIAGGSLHQRGYRRSTGAAPLKENLAAAILLRADWPAMARNGAALLDPLCGSATLLIEGAMMAADIAPGLGRPRFGFESLKVHDRAQWQALLSEAAGRAERGRASDLPEIRGYDSDPRVIRRAEENIARADLQKIVRVAVRPLTELVKPTHKPLPQGLIVTNPPYGERLGERSALPGLYRELGERLSAEFGGWRAAVFTSELALGKAIGLRSHKRYTLFNGAIEARLLLFDLTDNSLHDRGPGAGSPQALSPGAEMFANRVRKNRKRLAAWLRREQVECYRLYDADMPEYAVAVDVYGRHVHVAEYQAPASVSEEAAQRRMLEVAAALPEALAVPAERIVYKQRRRQRGSQQYERQDARGELLTVHENGLRLLVNLHDYLDTGLFLDHRSLRRRIRGESSGKDFLNLFCYTGSATVHAAAGGARSTTSVDTSNTYLDWLRKNLSVNGLGQGAHSVVRAECTAWLARCEQRYDLILLDP
ncbi:MAG: bifunctional 23S rRNA (guanine(2069)-N(7))-methyltransferase RlmK/23S rRNA (guanine(2445)-N(2))-methyltransferase RlmL, partial [Halioglobus sp.]|nr:bifunctional 23S rRNA (guanine(2069)-N(7))-methyltransferase RlmK/23S rRNA (guanine(2445)-N(2))-methyltransferase RlmL [Halioglobus sp.]